MKVIKFPEHKMKRRWLLKLRNADKWKTINLLFSIGSVLAGLAIVWFVLHQMNA